MCPGSCIAYTGPFKELEVCPMCGESRYDTYILEASKGKKKVPVQHIQALWCSPDGAKKMGHQQACTQEIINQLNQNDQVLDMYSDIYNKTSDCWIFIWVIIELDESFFFPSFQHISALQQEGLRMWNSLEDKVSIMYLFFYLGELT
ncbi:hypothetical protein K439DRAFT_1645261 [Ramaria rubella]|nr:hypothetical protein K439DRAFT_1645261 [Ramaria rubella]